MHNITRAEKKVRMFEPSFICCAFEAKFLPSKLRCQAHFNVCTCALVQSKHVVNNVGVFLCPSHNYNIELMIIIVQR